jgi:hypothetical protein
MKKIHSMILGIAFVLTVAFVGGSAVNAQETMMKKVGETVTDTSTTVAKKTVKGTKAVYKGGKRVGYTVGNKTWDGTKWVASNSWKGGKWIAVKTANGTKWVYRKAKGTAKRVP